MRFPKDSVRFKDLAAAFQSIFFVVAVVLGGAWTAYTWYWDDQERKQQRAREEKQRLAETEQKMLRELENLKLTVVVTPLQLPDASGYVSIRIDAVNSGAYPLVLDLTCDPVRVWRVDYGSGGVRGYKFVEALRPLTSYRTPTSPPERTRYLSTRLRAGGVQSYHFLTRLPDRGLYWIAFSATEKRPRAGTQPQQWACPDRSAGPPREPTVPAKRRSQSERDDDRTRWSSGLLYVAR